MKKYSLKELFFAGTFLVFFVTGILFVNLWGRAYLEPDSLFDPEKLKLIGQAGVDEKTLFFYLLSCRGKWLLLIWLLGYTLAGFPVLFFFLGWLGFSGGALLSIFLIRMHSAGLLLFLAAVLPHALVYVPMVWILAGGVYRRGCARFRGVRGLGSGEEEKAYLKTLALTAALLILGAVLESRVNPRLFELAFSYFF